MTRKTRPASWIKAALKEFEAFPQGVKAICLAALTIAALVFSRRSAWVAMDHGLAQFRAGAN